MNNFSIRDGLAILISRAVVGFAHIRSKRLS